ncbi:MAG: carboxylesterase family protein [Pseudomonadales bacterium]|nr:carboxylesterase family protein [Pseudomonadales bacterium]
MKLAKGLINVFGLAVIAIALSACQESTTTAPPAAEATSASTDSAEQSPIANTQFGPVRGFFDDGVTTFKGIRYGADTSTTRFVAPAAPSEWNVPADALAFGPACPQATRGRLSLFDSWLPEPDPGMSEDCLFLNVWTPSLDQAKRPVMVWLHGGGFTSGSGSSNAYDGVRLVNRGDIVVVSVNHRLNVFGYTHLDPYGDQYAGSGNAGMLDLISALTWVKENVSEFGGDPDNVLIFGESGGGWKVTTLMAMEAASGLFHRAVAQSGPALTLMEATTAVEQSSALLAELGIEAENIDALQALTTDEISSAAQRLAANGLRVGSRPVIDGVHNLRHPFTPAAPETSKGVPLLIGSTQTEMSLLIGAGQPALFDLTWDTLPGALAQAIPGVQADDVITGYRELHPDIDPPNLFFEATTDNSVFGRGSFELADRKAEQGGAPVYQYYMTWRSPVEGGKWGATHALDIGFVFDNVADSASMSGVGEEQQALADVMSEAWLAFARAGDPNHDGLPEWPTYDTTNRATMIFDTDSRVVNDPRGRERAILDAALVDAGP